MKNYANSTNVPQNPFNFLRIRLRCRPFFPNFYTIYLSSMNSIWVPQNIFYIPHFSTSVLTTSNSNFVRTILTLFPKSYSDWIPELHFVSTFLWEFNFVFKQFYFEFHKLYFNSHKLDFIFKKFYLSTINVSSPFISYKIDFNFQTVLFELHKFYFNST